MVDLIMSIESSRVDGSEDLYRVSQSTVAKISVKKYMMDRKNEQSSQKANKRDLFLLP